MRDVCYKKIAKKLKFSNTGSKLMQVSKDQTIKGLISDKRQKISIWYHLCDSALSRKISLNGPGRIKNPITNYNTTIIVGHNKTIGFFAK